MGKQKQGRNIRAVSGQHQSLKQRWYSFLCEQYTGHLLGAWKNSGLGTFNRKTGTKQHIEYATCSLCGKRFERKMPYKE